MMDQRLALGACTPQIAPPPQTHPPGLPPPPSKSPPRPPPIAPPRTPLPSPPPFVTCDTGAYASPVSVASCPPPPPLGPTANS